MAGMSSIVCTAGISSTSLISTLLQVSELVGRDDVNDQFTGNLIKISLLYAHFQLFLSVQPPCVTAPGHSGRQIVLGN